MDKQKILAHLQAIQDELEDKPKVVFKPEIGDWLELSDNEEFDGHIQVGKLNAYYTGTTGLPYEIEISGSVFRYKYARHPINHTDVLIKVNGGGMPEWIKGKDVTVFFSDKTHDRRGLTFKVGDCG